MEPIQKRVTQTVSEEVLAETPDIAKRFCSLDDEQQAEFFVEVAKISKTWEADPFLQWWWIGRALARLRGKKEDGASEAIEIFRNVLEGAEV